MFLFLQVFYTVKSSQLEFTNNSKGMVYGLQESFTYQSFWLYNIFCMTYLVLFPAAITSCFCVFIFHHSYWFRAVQVTIVEPNLNPTTLINFFFFLVLHYHSFRATSCNIWVWVYLLVFPSLEKYLVQLSMIILKKSPFTDRNCHKVSISCLFTLPISLHFLKQKNPTTNNRITLRKIYFDPQSLSYACFKNFALFLLPLGTSFQLTLPYSMASEFPTKRGW